MSCAIAPRSTADSRFNEAGWERARLRVCSVVQMPFVTHVPGCTKRHIQIRVFHPQNGRSSGVVPSSLSHSASLRRPHMRFRAYATNTSSAMNQNSAIPESTLYQ